MVVSARKNKKILRVVTQPRTPLEGTRDPTQCNKTNQLVGHSTSALTNPPHGTQSSKENQKSNNSTSKEEGQKLPNPRGNQPKDREGKKKVPTTILLFQRLRIFLYKWEPNAEDSPTYPVQSRLIYDTTKPFCNLFLSWHPTSGFPLGLLRTLQLSPSSPSQSEKSVCGCEIEKKSNTRDSGGGGS